MIELKGKNFIGMPRISSKKQEKGDSIEAQEKRFSQFCLSNECNLVDIYADKDKKHESATIDEDKRYITFSGETFIVNFNLKSRKYLVKAINEAINKTKKWDGILIFKWDRISRDPPFLKLLQLYLESLGKIIIPTDDPTDPLSAGIIQLVSKYEIDKMKARVRQTRTYRFEKGTVVGRPPFGYKPIFKDKEHRRGIIKIVPYPKESEIVKEVFKLASEGKSYKEVCEKLNLKPQQFYNIIKNKVYIGIIEFEGKENKGIHEPLISEETFNKVQKIFNSDVK